ncbi:MAG: lipid-A-disaccharide synthase [Pyrinomonadaceae bacterium]
MKRYKFMIVAGEASGDGHAAKLVRALHEIEPKTHFDFFGSAGEKLREAGVEAIIEADRLSIVGLAEIGRALPMFLKAFRSLKQAAIERNPDAVILVDFPDFNLRLAKSLKKAGLRVIYYISPQLWAWRKYRIRTVREYVDLMIAILPFEKDWYAEHGVTNVEYVGNPLAMEVRPTRSKDDFCKKYGIDKELPIVALLPGSRHKEIVRILPVMLAGASAIAAKRPEIQFQIALASNRDHADVRHIIDKSQIQGYVLPASLNIIENDTYNALNASDAAAVTSGTATLEAGILGTPMAVVYKTSALNYGLLEPIISVEHYGLINLIAGERVAKELIQGDLTAGSLSNELLRLLEPEINRDMRARLRGVANKLGHGGASKRAAEAILNIVETQ